MRRRRSWGMSWLGVRGGGVSERYQLSLELVLWGLA